MQIALIRHLPTSWNQQGFLQGKRDIALAPLTKKLEIEIEENKKMISEIAPFDKVLASSLIRTQQTAKHYGFENIEIEPLLDELDFGEFEGQPKQKLHQEYEYKWFHNPKELVLGESLQQFEQRIFSFLTKYKNNSGLLIFGHGSWIRAMISISETGTLQNMNQVEVPNNHITLLNVATLLK